MRASLATSLLLAIAGCSPTDSFTQTQSQVLLETNDGRLDLHFAPVDLRPGERLSVETPGARLESTAVGDRHQVTGFGRAIQRIVGLLDGREAHAVVSSRVAREVPGGETASSPTSVHRTIACDPNGYCTESVEYDYDLHDPSGEGTTSWKAPDGRLAIIDRLRFEFSAEPDSRLAQVDVTTPAALSVVH